MSFKTDSKADSKADSNSYMMDKDEINKFCLDYCKKVKQNFRNFSISGDTLIIHTDTNNIGMTGPWVTRILINQINQTNQITEKPITDFYVKQKNL